MQQRLMETLRKQPLNVNCITVDMNFRNSCRRSPVPHRKFRSSTLGHVSHLDREGDGDIEAAAVYIIIKLDSASLQQPQALRALSDLLAAIAELFATYQPR